MTIDERLGRIEEKIDALGIKVDAHMDQHKGDKERIATLEQASKEVMARSDRRYQLLLVIIGVVATAILAWIGLH